MNTIPKGLLLILVLDAPLITAAILLTAGVISFGGAAQPVIIAALFLMAFSIPFLLPPPQFDKEPTSTPNN